MFASSEDVSFHKEKGIVVDSSRFGVSPRGADGLVGDRMSEMARFDETATGCEISLSVS